MTTDHDIEIELDLSTIEELGRQRENENFRFRTYLKRQDTDRIDNIVHRLNREISDQIDCTACGNCCRNLNPCISDQDIDRLSIKLSVTESKVKDDYIEIDDGEQYFKNLPCSFLKDKSCTIYNDRPGDCESFPHLHKKHFISRLWGAIDNYSICLIVFNVFERLKNELNFR